MSGPSPNSAQNKLKLASHLPYFAACHVLVELPLWTTRVQCVSAMRQLALHLARRVSLRAAADGEHQSTLSIPLSTPLHSPTPSSLACRRGSAEHHGCRAELLDGGAAAPRVLSCISGWLSSVSRASSPPRLSSSNRRGRLAAGATALLAHARRRQPLTHLRSCC